jgi:hypothetical protein
MSDNSNPFNLETMRKTVYRAIHAYMHNVIIIWGELGFGKTTLMLQTLWDVVRDWPTVLSFVLEPHVCLKCGESWDAGQPYVYELMCPECSSEAQVIDSVARALEFAKQRWWVDPFPVDKKGLVKAFRTGQKFTVCPGKARGVITQQHPYLNFSFFELRRTIQSCVDTRIRLPAIGWDDVAVYFHRSNIQYMHPDVKNFFSRYSFVRQYIANLLITVPTIDFVPEQLALFCTADVLISGRGYGDFDVKRSVRSFYGRQKSFQKSYDGRNVDWSRITDKIGTYDVFDAYEEIRHAHAVEAFEKPEEIFVTTMPKAKEFTDEESLLS